MKTAKMIFNEEKNVYSVVLNDTVLCSRGDLANLERTWMYNKKVIAAGVTKVTPIERTQTGEVVVEETPQAPTFSIEKRFGFYENFLNMVINGVNSSMIVTGKGGLGKSFVANKVLEEKGLEQDVDYVVVKGYSTAKAMYRTLFENSDKVVIFDDCDSVLQDKVSLEILKTALDSYDKRIITWGSEGGFGENDLPTCFEFRGQVIFISNMPREKVNQALISRSLTVDLSMTKAEAIERMESILVDVLPEYPMSIKRDALEFLDANKEVCKDLNMRTLLKVSKVRSEFPLDWEDNAMYMITN